VLLATLTAGGMVYRKVFWKNSNLDGIAANTARLYLTQRLTSAIRARLFAGTQTDTRADISSPRLYGIGRLNSAILAGDSEFEATFIDGQADGIIQAGDTIAIQDMASESDTVGHLEFHVVDAVSWAGDVATVTLDGTVFSNAFAASRTSGGNTIYTNISSCLEQENIVSSAAIGTKASTAGTYDNVNYPVSGDNDGTVYQTWTITFSSATGFSVVGNTVGSVGSGNTSSAFAPNNPGRSRPYFTIPAGFFTGTWASGDTLQITTTPSVLSSWYMLDIQSGTSPVSLETFEVELAVYSGSV
jgi:hypothetical protein